MFKRIKFLQRIRFRTADLMWLSLIVAILILWYKDHRDLTNQIASAGVRDGWSVKQVLGKPNTAIAGDFQTAWASQAPDSQMEWLIVEFPRAVKAVRLQVEETYNPGALVRICSIDWQHNETEVWKGTDPVTTASLKGTANIPLKKPIRSRRFKIYLDSVAVPGWNEIDAVALHGEDGSKQWATDAWASSCFGANRPLPRFFWP